MFRTNLAIYILIGVIVLGTVGALVYNEITSNQEVYNEITSNQDKVTFKTTQDSFAERERIPIELSNNGEEPIYYEYTPCGCMIKILKNGIFQPTRCLACLSLGISKRLNPNEKIVLYERIFETGVYKRVISYSLSEDLSYPIIIETNEFEITQNNCPDDENLNLGPRYEVVYRIPPNCEFQEYVFS